MIADGSGALYGTTYNGGTSCGNAGCGTVFELTPSGSGYTEHVLHRFRGPPNDGAFPAASLLAGKNGTLFGTTWNGGTAGVGTVFALEPTRHGYKETILYNFRGVPHNPDGAAPFASLIGDDSGALYGTTAWDGGNHCYYHSRCGTVFKLTPRPSGGYGESILHHFSSAGDGAYPYTRLLRIGRTFYGITNNGGVGLCAFGGGGCGTLFALAPSGTTYVETLLHSFEKQSDGGYPESDLVVDSAGTLFGTTLIGGSGPSGGNGTVFEFAFGNR